MVYILDDEQYLVELAQNAFPGENFHHFKDSYTFIKAVTKQPPELLLIDLHVEHAAEIPPKNYLGSNPRLEGISVLEYLRKKQIKTPAILATRFASSDIFIRVFALDAIPVEVTEMEQAVRSLREKASPFLKNSDTEQLIRRYQEYGFVVADNHSVEILRLVEKVIPTDQAILILGESGVGKDALSRAIHLRSKGESAPYLNFTISAYPRNLLYSKLFGSVKKAYTDAGDMTGCFEEVGEGTLVFNEIGNLDLESQVQLLQVLDERYFYRLGDHKKRIFRGRVIALTNVNLLDSIKQGTFRDDLYNRLRKFYIQIPPLRDRRADIKAYVNYYFPHLSFSKSAQQFLFEEFQFPGNVRTLKYILDNLRFLSSTYPDISLDDIIAAIRDILKTSLPNRIRTGNTDFNLIEYLLTHGLTVEQLNHMLFEQAVQQFGKTWSPATWGKIGISKSTFYRKVRQIAGQNN